MWRSAPNNVQPEAAVRGVLDLDAFEEEVRRERQEQHELEANRLRLRQALVDDVDDLE